MSKNTKKLVPKLRFPEFRSAVGWCVEPLEKLCDVLNNRRKPITGSDREKGIYPYYGASGIVDFVKEFIFDERLLLIGEDGAKWGAFEKTAFIVDGKYWVNNHAHVLRPTSINDSFLENYFVKLDLAPYVTGAAPPKLTLGKLKEIPVPLPLLPKEQQKIADCLSSIDELINAQSQKVEALKTHKKVLTQQLFPREGETVPRLRFPEFRDAGEWKEKTLGQVAKYTKGFAFKSQDYRSQGIRVVRVSDLGADSIKPKNEKIFIATESASDYERYVLNKGEIIITTVGSKPDLIESAVGRGIFVHYSNEGLLNQNLLKLEPMSLVNSRFLFSNINTEKYQKFIASISRGNANQANIAVKDLMDFEIQVPTPEEQQKIADCLSSVDDLISSQNQKLEALKTHKKGLMQQLFPSDVEVST